MAFIENMNFNKKNFELEFPLSPNEINKDLKNLLENNHEKSINKNNYEKNSKKKNDHNCKNILFPI